ncbi:pyroglutamyl-peptidase [uncultured Corynebacterium sp.]|uniref:pyroglutamyl-peptidase I family protein n=1 Tax=uncultured Corynebacterium sp. TaxID=159447 RepID=UPI0028E6A995|nr:pyroglutamyl-peptidase [uncultured Corynebacterium sp.]
MRILLTAFSPFNGATENTSLAVVTNLAELLSKHKTQVLELPVAFANSHKVAISTAKQFRPDIILSFGEDTTRNSINVETQAYNQQQATIPDNDGFQPKGKAIIPGGIPTIATNFPIWPKAVVASLRQTPWPMELSANPGGFVCNHLAYHLYSSPFPTLFMHVPALHPSTSAATAATDGDTVSDAEVIGADTATPLTPSDSTDAVQKIAETVWMFVDKLS